jgi:dethiobiotin synthetase
MTAKPAYFVTGTDTEIGKTLISAALLHQLAACGLRVAAMKPIAAGAEWRDGAWHNDDADILAAAASVRLPIALTTPYLLQDPAAPHIAAAAEGVTINTAHILACYDRVLAQADAVVVEGVGGFVVPLSRDADTAGLALQLGLPVIMVVGMRLGCLSHALLTAEAIVARGLVLAGWVANAADPDMRHMQANIDALAERLPAPLLGIVPRLPEPGASPAAVHLDCSVLPGWPKAADSR